MLGNPLLLGDDGYQISRSVRLRSSASAFFNRTPASAGNRRTWTWSGWVKRGTLGASVALFSTPNGSADTSWFDIVLDANNKLNVSGFSTFWRVTTQVFRDPSAWYHVLVSVDTTQSTANNRIQVFVNGLQVSNFDTTNNMAQNADTGVNAAAVHYVGRSSASYLDGYLTEVNFIDGQALDPSSFGQTDPVTGVWSPKKYNGTYGTNGFYLPFNDPTSTTTIAQDRSGNGNNWTANNISVTAGVTYDSMLDVPTQWADGGNGRGNYAVMNPLAFVGTATPTNSNGNLTSSRSSGLFAYGSMGVSSGQYYWEIRIDANGSQDLEIGVTQGITGINNTAGAYGWGTKLSRRWDNGSLTSSSIGTATVGDIVGIALDLTGSTFTVFKNGVQLYQTTGVVAGTYLPASISGGVGGLDTVTANFGQRPFAYTPPTGFKALNTLNLPTPTILKGNQFMDATLWTGNQTARSIVNSGAMQPDLVWVKRRDSIENHQLSDAVRGANVTLFSNTTGAELTYTDNITAFNSNGFSLGVNTNVNVNAGTFVGWQWKEGPTQGFDIVTYTGNGANRTIAHSLGVAPSMIIVKSRSLAATAWETYTAMTGAGNRLRLNETAASTSDATAWNNTAPTSTVFSIGTNGNINTNAATYVAYLFAEVAGFSRFGSYTGNGSADGPFVWCGFRPRFVMLKVSSGTTGNWGIYDTARDTFNVMPSDLNANISNAEAATINTQIDVTANGFKIRGTDGDINASSCTYIFAAFAEHPFKNALAR